MNVEGKTALITGGGTGVGRATALALAERGCHVAVNYSRSKAEAEATAAEVETKGVRCIPIQADVSQDVDCRRLVETTVGELGRLDVLVQSAGTTSFIPHPNLEDVKDEDWEKIFAVNVKGKFQCARAAKAAMDAAGAGHVVNVSSVAGIAGVGSSIPYCASKAAANNLTITLARAFAPKIQVNAVAPGFITGRWLREGLGEAAYEAVKSAMEARAPLGKVCDPEDVADAIVSLVTGSALVTGQVLPVEGGMLIAG
jgi:3-oxoacyl-[acyl-carrier protein] reductase